MKIFAIDPGNINSAYVILDNDLKPIEFGILDNYDLLKLISKKINEYKKEISFTIEMIASYGMAVGKTVFDTCVWIGRFSGAAEYILKEPVVYIYRKDEKMNLCHTMKAKDANIRQALIDRFGVVGTMKDKGWFYGVKKDIWAAIAVGVTYYDLYLNNKKEEGHNN